MLDSNLKNLNKIFAHCSGRITLCFLKGKMSTFVFGRNILVQTSRFWLFSDIQLQQHQKVYINAVLNIQFSYYTAYHNASKSSKTNILAN